MRLVVRTDASATIGAGHAMRCLAIAEAWIEQGGEVVFAMREAPAAVRARIEHAGARVEWPAPAASYVVVDGYHIDRAEQAAFAASGARVLVVDDRGESATAAATIIVNPNPSAAAALYAGLDATLLLGRDYTLVRREFQAAANAPRHVLVSFGGADVANLTPRALEALAPLDVEVLVIAGPANPRAGELVAPRASIRIVPSLDDMASAMRASHFAIVAAGSTCWELAACGVPMIAVAVAENQRDVVKAVADLGLGITLRDDPSAADMRAAIDRMDEPTRAAMARRGPQIIDGRGAFRVCEVLRGELR